MATEMQRVQWQNGRACHARACRLIASATSGHSEQIAEAVGMHPGQLRAYGSLHAMETGTYRQPLYTTHRILAALMEVRGEAGRLAAIEAVQFLADLVGCSLIPAGQSESKALNEELADAEQAAARAD